MTAPNTGARANPPRGSAPRGNVVRQSRGGSNRRGFYVAVLLVLVLGVAALYAATQRGGTVASAPVVVPPAPATAARPIGYTLGSPSAPVEIVEFADFECSVCGQYFAVTEPDVRKQLVDPGIARYTLYDIQVNTAHANSPAASLAAACANEQGKFWPMHDRLYGAQDEWNSQATSNPRPIFAGYAQQLGLDMTRWNQCFDQRRHVQNLAINRAEAERIGFQGTPTFVINGKMMRANVTFDAIKAMVDSARAGAAGAKPVSAR